VLALKPQVIVFDEATAMLDPQGRAEVLETMKRLNKEQGITIIFITHFMEEAVDADRVIVMADGLVLKSGSPKEILYDRELLEKAGLMPPFAASMCRDLKEAGIEIREDLVTIEELVNALCSLR
jgi:energy-coupling factor transport system ATP-binding protein